MVPTGNKLMLFYNRRLLCLNLFTFLAYFNRIKDRDKDISGFCVLYIALWCDLGIAVFGNESWSASCKGNRNALQFVPLHFSAISEKERWTTDFNFRSKLRSCSKVQLYAFPSLWGVEIFLCCNHFCKEVSFETFVIYISAFLAFWRVKWLKL